MDDSQRIKSFEELISLFKANQFPYTVDPSNLIIETPSRAAPLPGNLYYKWNTTAPYLQLVHYILEDVPADRVLEVETALTRLNLFIECPCFGYDHTTRRVYYRITVPVFPDDGVSAGTLEKLTITCIAMAKAFHPLFVQVVTGRPGAEADKMIAEMKSAPRPKGG